MLRIAICDNDRLTLDCIANRMKILQLSMEADLEIYKFDNGTALLDSLIFKSYHLVYMDIEIGDVNGLQLGKTLRQQFPYCVLIYISRYESFKEELFEIEAFRFIRKPIDHVIFDKYFHQALEKISKNELFFDFMFKGVFHRISTKEILYFESHLRTVNIVRKNSKDNLYFYGKLNNIEKNLVSNHSCFLRIHQSYLINYFYIRTLRYDEVEMINNIVLQISKDRQKSIRNQWSLWLKGSDSWGVERSDS